MTDLAYQLMLAHIRMLIIIQMYRKRKRYILLTVLSFFLNIAFQRSKSVFTLDEIIYTSHMFHPEYIPRTKVARVVLKLFITITVTIMLWQLVEEM